MCGIFGIVVRPVPGTRPPKIRELLSALFQLSESRGKEASGLAAVCGDEIRVLKSPVPSSKLMRSASYASLVDAAVSDRGVAVIGHSRLVTNGTQAEHDNNQPVNVDEMVGVHNGIIVNEAKLWEARPELERRGEVDTELLFRLIGSFATTDGSFVGGMRTAYAEVIGVANIAVFVAALDQLMLATNNGSIYYASDVGARAFVFASEEYILRKALEEVGLSSLATKIVQLAAGRGLLVDLATASVQSFALAGEQPAAVIERAANKRSIVVEQAATSRPRSRAPSSDVEPSWFTDLSERNRAAIAALRRCVRCVQPETLPFIGLDRDGVCIECREHVPVVARGPEVLEALLEPHRTRDGRPEVLVPLSGGRDSCYALHYIKTVLGVTPIAYTYDWGMVTDLARRNASRLCSQLGVEHIIVSADIAQKRDYIRKNVNAWLRQPDLGVVPLFMAGDKQFLYHASKLQERTGVKLQIWGNNRLERSDFKTGFCGFDRGGYKDSTGESSAASLVRMRTFDNARMIGYYLRAFVTNPAYLNASIPDTLFSYFLYYVRKLDFLDIYDYVPWDEDVIVRTLIDTYDWEVATDTTSTWRIGDGSAAFYNYIYWTAAGFTESDTFRSGQVRQGSRSRADAQRVVDDENRPRYASLAWYCRTVGIDLERTLHVINAIPKHYPPA